MKRTLHASITGFLLLILVLPMHGFATKHIISVQNFNFSPSMVNNVQIGDTMRWQWVSGSHTTTSSTIPAGAAAWDSPINSSVTVYEYRVTTAGTYNYVCTPHAAGGMVGLFTVSAAATLNVTPTNRNVSATAGNTTFSVTSNSAWTVSSNQSWCTVTPSGSGNGTITATYTTNTVTTVRIATITVTVNGLPSQMVTVTQAAAAPTLVVSPPNQDVNAQSGSTSFSVNSNSSWTASSNQTWCTVNSSGTGNGTINASYTENSTVDPRIALITVSVAGLPDATVTVSQAGAEPTLLVGPTNQEVSYLAGSIEFLVTSNSSWEAGSNADWCTTTASGTGNGIITATFTENTTSQIRVATIMVMVSEQLMQEVTLTQAAAPVGVAKIPLSSFNIYPNPASHTLSIDTKALNSGSIMVQIVGMSGNVVFSENYLSGTSIPVNVSKLASGSYFVRMISGTKSVEKPLIINH